jgi:hypothetical protein
MKKRKVLRLSKTIIEIDFSEQEPRIQTPGLTVCLHPECESALPEDGSRAPYCSSVCFLHNNMDFGMPLAETKRRATVTVLADPPEDL